jgi:hypothetical protein
MTDGQHLNIAMISASVPLVILQFLKRRLLRNKLPGEVYKDMGPALGHQLSAHELGPLFIVHEDSSSPGNHH